jgi:hypothetical protein
MAFDLVGGLKQMVLLNAFKPLEKLLEILDFVYEI